MTEVMAWAASNGDRSENADYHYGKRRLRQIDGRIRFLTKRIDAAEVVDPEAPRAGGGDEGILRSDRALSQCRGSGASGEHLDDGLPGRQPDVEREFSEGDQAASGPKRHWNASRRSEIAHHPASSLG